MHFSIGTDRRCPARYARAALEAFRERSAYPNGKFTD